MRAVIDLCLAAFRFAIQEALPAECVKRNLVFSASSENLLTINNRSYQLNNNVHIVAFGKAACGMVTGAEAALGNHLLDGIASVPVGSEIPSGLKTKFLTGALSNLPDAEAVKNANKITEFVQKIRAQDQIILFLISGGGSALLPSPIDGITLEEKLEVIRTLSTNGADIKQLNLVRSALSNLKGGKLARLGAPSKMISLIISDVIGDPLQLIASGPTVLDKSDVRTPQQVFDELGVGEKIPENVTHLLASSEISSTKEVTESEIDVNNVIVGNNQQVLQLLAQHFQQNAQVYPLIITSTLEGDASELGNLIAEFIIQTVQKRSLNTQSVVELCKRLSIKDNLQINSTSWKDLKKVVLLFGGETTVKFDASLVGHNCKGGRNQEFVLSTFYKLLKAKENCSETSGKYAFFSLGTDGQGMADIILKYVDI